jgi:hypothetical protein
MWSRLRREFRNDARAWFAAIFLLVIAVNIAVFPKIETLTEAQRSKAFSRADTGEFLELAFGSAHSRTRFDLYYVVGELAPGAVVSLDTSAWSRRAIHVPYLHYLGEVNRVESEQPVSVPLPDDLAAEFAPFVVASSDGGSGGPAWRLALASIESQSSDVPDPEAMVRALLDGWAHEAPEAALSLVVTEVPASSGQGDEYDEYVVWVIDAALLDGWADA